MKETAKRLLLLRIALGRTQEEMGKLAGVGANAWQNYEKARTEPKKAHTEELYRTMGIPPEWIYFGAEVRMADDLLRKIAAAEKELWVQPDKDRRRYRPSKKT